MQLRDTTAGVLSGTVFLPDGVTPAGRGVQVTATGALPDVVVETSDQGKFRFAKIFPEGPYRLTLSDPVTGGRAQLRVYLRAGQDLAQDVRLKGRGTVRVSVVDGANLPVTSAYVKLQETDFPSRSYEAAVEPPRPGRGPDRGRLRRAVLDRGLGRLRARRARLGHDAASGRGRRHQGAADVHRHRPRPFPHARRRHRHSLRRREAHRGRQADRSDHDPGLGRRRPLLLRLRPRRPGSPRGRRPAHRPHRRGGGRDRNRRPGAGPRREGPGPGLGRRCRHEQRPSPGRGERQRGLGRVPGVHSRRRGRPLRGARRSGRACGGHGQPRGRFPPGHGCREPRRRGRDPRARRGASRLGPGDGTGAGRRRRDPGADFRGSSHRGRGGRRPALDDHPGRGSILLRPRARGPGPGRGGRGEQHRRGPDPGPRAERRHGRRADSPARAWA